MLALLTSSADPGVEVAETADPEPLPNEALVAVKATSLNRGEVRRLASVEPGQVHGWDLAGVVRRAAADGSGPPEGSRVVGLLNPGAWAQLAAVPTADLAPIADGVSFSQAACLPVAGITALLALDIGGNPLGRRVLVTGASGGVGRFAVQLAHGGGAHVTAVSASPERAKGLRELGADEVIHELTAEGEETFDIVVEGVGGASLGAALQRVAADGTVASFASSAPEPVSFPARSLFARGSGAVLYGLYVFHELPRRGGAAPFLSRLGTLVQAGRLDLQIDLEVSWRDAAEAIAALLDRRVAGKAVLLID